MITILYLREYYDFLLFKKLWPVGSWVRYLIYLSLTLGVAFYTTKIPPLSQRRRHRVLSKAQAEPTTSLTHQPLFTTTFPTTIQLAVIQAYKAKRYCCITCNLTMAEKGTKITRERRGIAELKEALITSNLILTTLIKGTWKPHKICHIVRVWNQSHQLTLRQRNMQPQHDIKVLCFILSPFTKFSSNIKL